jgi:hypothetical protein
MSDQLLAGDLAIMQKLETVWDTSKTTLENLRLIGLHLAGIGELLQMRSDGLEERLGLGVTNASGEHATSDLDVRGRLLGGASNSMQKGRTIFVERLQADSGGLRADGIESVRQVSTSSLDDLLDDIGVGVINNSISTEALDNFGVSGTGGGDDFETRGMGLLNGISANGSRTSPDLRKSFTESRQALLEIETQ